VGQFLSGVMGQLYPGGDTFPEPEMHLPDTVPALKKYIPDIKAYDELFLTGGLQL